LDYLDGGVQLSPWARYQFIYDPPIKPDRAEDEKYANSILTPLRETVNNATEELLVASPYFVLLDEHIERAATRINNGLEMTVITNSLASTNHNVVHSGYAPTRKRLLKAGIKLYETRPDARIAGIRQDTESKSSLHTKAFIVDRRWFYLGSFNWDPRSTYINTESGVIIDSPQIAEEIAQRTEKLLPTAAYQVFLDDRDRLRWKTLDAQGNEVIYSKEPETSWWTRFKVSLMSLLPLDNQL
jgi:putative cardiolipin synthase